MKKIILLSIIIFPWLIVRGQDTKSVVIKTNALIYMVKTGFNFSAEIQTSKRKSLNFTFEKGNNKYTYDSPTWNKFTVVAIEKRKYFYANKNNLNPSGLFVGPYIKYRYKDKNSGTSGGFLSDGGIFTSHSAGGGISAGYQNFLYKRIAIEAKLGAGLMVRINAKGINTPTLLQPDGLLGLSFGVRI
jgi:uncharacterized membrane protein YgcG